jgi:hypothetical protein
MPRAAILITVICIACGLFGCGPRAVDPKVTADGGESGDGGAQPSQCALDGDCGAGMVCEGCGLGSPNQCVPGCRTSQQCPPAMICAGPVRCLTCPCPPGWCQLDPCRDVDGDGFVPASPDPLSCPGKQLGDCDDSQSQIHPRGLEVCANSLDDDCDGLVDQQDSQACDRCSSYACRGPLGCVDGQQCARGCCTPCPRQLPPTCGADECLQEGALGESGCRAPMTCGPCLSCVDATPVCGEDFKPYQNRCRAQTAGVGILHDGACLPHEGLACGRNDWCGSGLYCGTVTMRCQAKPSCMGDSDCPLAVDKTVLCGDGGIAALVCQDHRCLTRCD